MKNRTIQYLENFFEEHKDLNELQNSIKSAIQILVETATHNKILVCGNGGSAADSEHISGELLKSFMLKRPIDSSLRQILINTYEDGEVIANNLQQGIKCIPLTSFSALNTAFANDCNSDYIFAQLVSVLGVSGDCIIAISTSGNSKNVLHAVKLAKLLNIKVIALTGASGGKLKEYADVLINAPSNIVYKIQEYHLPIYHLLCLCVESELFEM